MVISCSESYLLCPTPFSEAVALILLFDQLIDAHTWRASTNKPTMDLLTLPPGDGTSRKDDKICSYKGRRLTDIILIHWVDLGVGKVQALNVILQKIV